MRRLLPLLLLAFLAAPRESLAQGGPQPGDEPGTVRTFPPLEGVPVHLFSTEDFQALVPLITGKAHTGIGLLPLLSVDIDLETGALTVITPVRGGPAALAGVHAGDVITRVAGKSTEGMSLAEVMLLTTGEVGEPIPLTLRRDGETVDLELVCAPIPARESVVRTELVEEEGFLVGYVGLEMFTAAAVEQMGLGLTLLKTRGADAYVLDLRDDPGGALPAALQILGYFTGPVRVGGVLRRGGLVTELEAEGAAILDGAPVAVLVNEGTASAAELTAAALQEILEAPVVGTATAGKGLLHELRGRPEGGVMLVSTGRLRSLSGRDLLTEGVAPDDFVPMRPSPVLGLGIDPASEEDLQYQRAVLALEPRILR